MGKRTSFILHNFTHLAEPSNASELWGAKISCLEAMTAFHSLCGSNWGASAEWFSIPRACMVFWDCLSLRLHCRRSQWPQQLSFKHHSGMTEDLEGSSVSHCLENCRTETQWAIQALNQCLLMDTNQRNGCDTLFLWVSSKSCTQELYLGGDGITQWQSGHFFWVKKPQGLESRQFDDL